MYGWWLMLLACGAIYWCYRHCRAAATSKEKEPLLEQDVPDDTEGLITCCSVTGMDKNEHQEADADKKALQHAMDCGLYERRVAVRALAGEKKALADAEALAAQRIDAEAREHPADTYDVVLDFDTVANGICAWSIQLSKALRDAAFDKLIALAGPTHEELLNALADLCNLKNRGVVSVVGFFNKGKTFIINRLANSEKKLRLPSDRMVHTKGLSLVNPPEAKHIFLDTAGTNAPSEGGGEKDMLDKKCVEEIIRNVVSELTDQVIVVVSELTWQDQQWIWNLRRSSGKNIYVVHNWSNVSSVEECLTLWQRDVIAINRLGEGFGFVEMSGRGEASCPVYSKEGGAPFLRHLFLAKDGSPAGNRFNEPAFNALLGFIDAQACKMKVSENIFKRMLRALQRNLENYYGKGSAPELRVNADQFQSWVDHYRGAEREAANALTFHMAMPAEPVEEDISPWEQIDKQDRYTREKERASAPLFVCTTSPIVTPQRTINADASGVGVVLSPSPGLNEKIPYDVVDDDKGLTVIFDNPDCTVPEAYIGEVLMGAEIRMCLCITVTRTSEYMRDGLAVEYVLDRNATPATAVSVVFPDPDALEQKPLALTDRVAVVEAGMSRIFCAEKGTVQMSVSGDDATKEVVVAHAENMLRRTERPPKATEPVNLKLMEQQRLTGKFTFHIPLNLMVYANDKDPQVTLLGGVAQVFVPKIKRPSRPSR